MGRSWLLPLSLPVQAPLFIYPSSIRQIVLCVKSLISADIWHLIQILKSREPEACYAWFKYWTNWGNDIWRLFQILNNSFHEYCWLPDSLQALIWCHSPATRLTAQTAARWHQLTWISSTESAQTFAPICCSYFFRLYIPLSQNTVAPAALPLLTL